MAELTDIDGVGPTLSDRLEENGYDLEALADADPANVADLDNVTDGKAVEFVVQAENLVEDEDDTEGAESDSENVEEDEGDDTTTPEETEEQAAQIPDDDADDEDESEDDTPDEREVTLAENGEERRLVTTALVNKSVDLHRQNRSRYQQTQRVLEKFDEGDTVSLTAAELNSLYSALHELRIDYQGQNEIDRMNVVRGVEDRVNEVRRDNY